jgi:hypothetical protein
VLARLGAEEQIAELAARLRRHAAQAPPSWGAFLLMMSLELRIDDQLRTILPPPPRPGELDLTDHETVRWIANAWSEAGDQTAITEFDELITSKALNPDAGINPETLVNALGLVGTGPLVELAARIPLTHPGMIAWLLEELRRRDGGPGLTALLTRNPAAAVELNGADADDVAVLLAELRDLGQDDQIAVLVGRQLAVQVSTESAAGSASLLTELAAVGASDQILTLATHAATDVIVDSVWHVSQLLKTLADVGAAEALAVLSGRAAAKVTFTDARDVILLLRTFEELSLPSAIALLMSRNLAVNLPFGESRSERHAWPTLLAALKVAGLDDQVKTTATRMAAHADLSRRGTTVEWADAMRAADANDQVTELARRAADSGEFDLFLRIDRSAAERFRFGREPDRTPSPPWTWRDLAAD